MKKLLLILLLFASNSSAYSQDKPKRKHYFPVWTYHQDSITINGISLGLSTFDMHDRQTYTNGIKLELVGAGLFVFLFKDPPISSRNKLEGYENNIPSKYDKSEFSEIINGLSLSATGNFCYCLINGISLGAIGQYNDQINGFSASVFTNYAEIHNGIQIAGMGNSTVTMNGIQVALFNHVYKGKGMQLALASNRADIKFEGVQIAPFNETNQMKGLQIGVFNRSENFRGIQIGLWNVNQERRMPLINWSFGK